MKAGRTALVVLALVVAAIAVAPAFARQDPTTGGRSADHPTVLVTPTSSIAPHPAATAGDGFAWTDAAIGAVGGLAVAGLGGLGLRLLRRRPEAQPAPLV